jgi:hypothetical protein
MTSAPDEGTELMVHNPSAVPGRFDLLFSPIAQSWRECSVIFRRYQASSIRVPFRVRHLDLCARQHNADHQNPEVPKSAAGVKPTPHRRNADRVSRIEQTMQLRLTRW